MAKDISNGQREYGIVHVNEEEMREAGVGVFARKNAGGSPANKSRAAAPETTAEAVSDRMTKAELSAIAKREGVDFETDDNKADLIAKIEKARK